jgi:CheY-like chemotaxis protein
MVRQTLVGLGYRDLTASDGEPVFRLCETEPPALAILDVIMPRMGGPAAAAALARVANLSVLFASGYSESADSSRVQLPSSRYLQQPHGPRPRRPRHPRRRPPLRLRLIPARRSTPLKRSSPDSIGVIPTEGPRFRRPEVERSGQDLNRQEGRSFLASKAASCSPSAAPARSCLTPLFVSAAPSISTVFNRFFSTHHPLFSLTRATPGANKSQRRALWW